MTRTPRTHIDIVLITPLVIIDRSLRKSLGIGFVTRISRCSLIAWGYELRPECVLFLIEAIAVLIGEALCTGKGVRRFGKQSWRSTGAVFLSCIGIEVIKIQTLARWCSPVVTHYTRLDHFTTITADFCMGRT